MCDRTAGVAGTPRAPCPFSLLAEAALPGRIFLRPDQDTTRIRTAYGRDTDEIRRIPAGIRTGYGRRYLPKNALRTRPSHCL